MIYPKIPLAQSIIEICKAKGITDIVISPGSRNAPLTIGFVNNPFFKCYSIVDERCAAFFAMGIAQQIKKPVAVVCTSGSALLNYYPAVAEAFYSQIPVVVISADRPTEKIDIGDGQTIRQQNVFQNHSLYNANLKDGLVDEAENEQLINEAINTAIEKKGPVHINAPFEEPLYDTIPQLTVSPEILASKTNEATISSVELESYATQWNAASKKLILIGTNEPNTIDSKIIEYWAQDPSVIVMTETTSNVHHATFLDHIDTIITPFTKEDFLAFQPDILITFGGMVVSKRIKAFLRGYQPKEHWHIDVLRAYNTYGCLTKHFEVSVNTFWNALIPLVQNNPSDYKEHAHAIQLLRAQKHTEYLKSIPFSDFKVFEKVIPALPDNSMLHLSNSSAIRYAQLVPIDPSIEVFCNRGTSGIDGSTSTAVGAAVASSKMTILLTGDIGFFYDSNAIWNNYTPSNFKIILINNGGGGIFRILPGHQESEVFNTFFETSHQLSAEQLAKMYDYHYSNVSTEADLVATLPNFFNSNDKPCLLEIHTPEKLNNDILLQYFKNLV
ncbi:2-succinyl-5-enolpyruvyl-6-hydroxy-3-cyclohexene-1-carboxylic-acid synthase [Flavobacterium sp. '19STA2R22 D10 B1']|uniref:2-succinyl-5-enolpyruvyl-6-hydroxy-3- cyclohexene-1-carboxylic-acid synthase n=1 Tax=Flavobacterium aerium TaxID=3037261 RepID=UPI00278C2704|nr:2-succinyl-5-enolpyruvyl-6-hydroxy-3-cyclohexene-1-carboxylic-acid synthase [Flavobacterium sp. '19STA2R22 D10 B1']